MYLRWSFLQRPLTVFTKSPILEIYLTDYPKFVFDSEIHFMNTKTETTYIKLVKCALMTLQIRLRCVHCNKIDSSIYYLYRDPG